MKNSHSIERFGALSPDARSAILAAIAERLAVDYCSFCKRESWGNPDVYREVLNAVWDHLKGKKMTSEACRSLYKQFLQVAPHWDDFGNALDGHYSSLALLCAVQSCFEQLERGSSVDPSEAIQFGYARFLPPGLFDHIAKFCCRDNSIVDEIRRSSASEQSVVNWEKEIEIVNDES